MVVDKLYQLPAHSHRAVLRTQQHIGLGLGIVNLKEELSLALIILHQRLDIIHQRFVYHRTVHDDGKLLQAVLLHGLEILHGADLEVEIVAVAVTGYTLRRNEDGAALYHDASPVAPVLTEERQLARSFEILDGDEAARLSGLGELGFHPGDDAAEHHILLLGKLHLVAQFRAVGIAEVAEDDFVIVERMSREIDAHELTLPVEPLDGAPGFSFRYRRGGYLHRLYASEERGSCLALLLLVELTVSYERIQEGIALAVLAEVLLAADAEAVETATQSQTFECLAVDIGEIHALGKIEDVLIRAVLQALCHDGIGGRSSHSLDGGESEAYLAMLVHTEGTVALVYIRSQGLDVHRLALLHQLGNLGDLRKAAGHQRCHVFGWIVCLEIGCLIGYPGIAGGVRLVEGVGGKLLPVAPDLLEHSRIVAVLLSLLDELRLHRIYDSLLLLTHRLTEGIRLASGEACQLAGKEHHLLLIHRDAVGILEVFLHAGDIVGDGLLAVLAGDEVGDVIHRSRTVEGVHGDEVLENRRLQLAEILLHTR